MAELAPIPQEPDLRVEELERQLAQAQAQLRARDKTVDALVRRAQKMQHSQQTAYSTVEQSAALQAVVRRKTRELADQNLRLEEAHRVLHETQAELLQAQKLESIGRLAAGVAHEINTPVQFVNDSLHFLRDGIGDLLRLTDALGVHVEALSQGAPAEEVLPRLVEAEEEADLGYLREQLPRALERCADGLDRVSTIVRAMREFAHPDAPGQVADVDLNRAVESTLIMARNEYKYVADIEVDLKDVPTVRCIPGEINQVLLNLVINAAHAIADAQRPERGRITVSTGRCERGVVVRIADTGCGIPPEIQHRIFDPFFTTKEVGRGTGQGLAIAHNVVVVKHGGTLLFETTPGVGTTFIVTLPVERDGGRKPREAA